MKKITLENFNLMCEQYNNGTIKFDTDATYVRAAAFNIVFESFNSWLSIKFNSTNCFFALDDALNSTGRVINWNNNIANNKINPIKDSSKKLKIIPIITTK